MEFQIWATERETAIELGQWGHRVSLQEVLSPPLCRNGLAIMPFFSLPHAGPVFCHGPGDDGSGHFLLGTRLLCGAPATLTLCLLTGEPHGKGATAQSSESSESLLSTDCWAPPQFPNQ